MSELRTIGLASIKVGDVSPDGGMGIDLSSLGITSQDTATMEQDDPETTEFYSEELDDPIEAETVMGKTRIKWAISDFSPAVLLKALGGTVTGISPNDTWNSPETAERIEKSIEIITKRGIKIQIPRAIISAKINLQLGKKNIGLIEINATVLNPSKTGVMPIYISRVGDTGTLKYYVSTTGNDSNDGLTPATAWQTLQHAEANSTPNSIIALKRGDTWTFDGSTSLAITSSNKTWDGSLWGVGSKAAIKSTAGRTQNHYAIVNIINCSFVNFKNITIDGNNTKECNGIVVGGAEDNHYAPGTHQGGESFITVENCDILNCGDATAYANALSIRTYFNPVSNITFLRNNVDGASSHCISLYPVRLVDGGNGSGISNVYVGYNTCTNFHKYTGNTGYGIHLTNDLDNILIEQNIGTPGAYGTNSIMTVESNDASLGKFSTNLTIRYNKFFNNYIASVLSFLGGQAVTAQIYGNLLVNIGAATSSGTMGVRVEQNDSGGRMWTGASFEFYHNTIVLDKGRGIDEQSNIAGTTKFKNNVIYNSGSTNNTDLAIYNPDAGTMVVSNNACYVPNCATNSVLSTAYRTSAQLLTDNPTFVVGNPQFINNTSDWHLQATSPLKNAGVVGLGILTDMDEISYLSPPTIGAFEIN